MVEGTLDELEGLHLLYQLWVKKGMGEKFINWVYLSDSIDLLPDGYGGMPPFVDLTKANIRETIKKEASCVI